MLDVSTKPLANSFPFSQGWLLNRGLTVFYTGMTSTHRWIVVDAVSDKLLVIVVVTK